MTLEEKKQMLATLLLQKAIDRGVKLLQKERQRDWQEKPLERKFFGRPL